MCLAHSHQTMIWCGDPMAIEEIIKFWKCNYYVCSVFIDISVHCGRVLKAFSCLYYQFCYTMHNQYVFAFCLVVLQLLFNCVEFQIQCIIQSHCVGNIFLESLHTRSYQTNENGFCSTTIIGERCQVMLLTFPST